MIEKLVAFTRGTLDESTHFGSLAVVDAHGTLIASVGDPTRVTFMRSAAKPFQAMVFVESGAVDAYGVSPAELALVAASHSGEPRHTEAVRRLLARAGLGPDDLQTGTHPPMHPPTREGLERRGEPPSPLHHNCSGKHCGMLCVCVHRGWDRRGYVRPDHPLQREILALMSEVASVPSRQVEIGVDGCGVPTFALPLTAIARAFARLASGTAPGAHGAAAARIRNA